MGKAKSGVLNLTARKKRNLSLPQCFARIYYKELNLEATAQTLRNEFIQQNPTVAAKWLKKNSKSSGFIFLDDFGVPIVEDEAVDQDGKKTCDPTAIVRFRQLAIKQAWANATEEPKSRAQAEREKQDEGLADVNDEARTEARVVADLARSRDHLHRTLSQTLDSLQEQTGLYGSIYLCGTDMAPNAKPGTLVAMRISTTTRRMNGFDQFCPQFTKNFERPFTKWVSAEIAEDVHHAAVRSDSANAHTVESSVTSSHKTNPEDTQRIPHTDQADITAPGSSTPSASIRSSEGIDVLSTRTLTNIRSPSVTAELSTHSETQSMTPPSSSIVLPETQHKLEDSCLSPLTSQFLHLSDPSMNSPASSSCRSTLALSEADVPVASSVSAPSSPVHPPIETMKPDTLPTLITRPTPSVLGKRPQAASQETSQCAETAEVSKRAKTS